MVPFHLPPGGVAESFRAIVEGEGLPNRARYTPRGGMCWAISRILDEEIISEHHRRQLHLAIVEMMEMINGMLEDRGLDTSPFLAMCLVRGNYTREEAEKVCFEIYSNWDNRREIFERAFKG